MNICERMQNMPNRKSTSSCSRSADSLRALLDQCLQILHFLPIKLPHFLLQLLPWLSRLGSVYLPNILLIIEYVLSFSSLDASCWVIFVANYP